MVLISQPTEALKSVVARVWRRGGVYVFFFLFERWMTVGIWVNEKLNKKQIWNDRGILLRPRLDK